MRNLSLAPHLVQLSDTDIERAIRTAHRALVNAKGHGSKASAWRVLCQLIRIRSPEAIARMEQERGLVRRQ
jgi:hypothetical protein